MTTLKGLRPTATAAQPGRNPVGVVKHRSPLPRVARPSQPWALLRNPFGILSRNFARVPGIMRHLFRVVEVSLRRLLQFLNPLWPNGPSDVGHLEFLILSSLWVRNSSFNDCLTSSASNRSVS